MMTRFKNNSKIQFGLVFMRTQREGNHSRSISSVRGQNYSFLKLFNALHIKIDLNFWTIQLVASIAMQFTAGYALKDWILRWIFIKRTSLNEIFHKSVVLFLISLCGRHRLIWDETLFKCIRPSFPNTRLNLNNQWGKCPFIDAYCCVRTNEWFQDNNCESYLFTLNNPGER